MLVDSHAHLNFPELLADIDGVLARAKEAGVEKIIDIGTSLDDSLGAIEIAQKHDNLFATVGIHPNDDPAVTADNIDWGKFEELAKMPKVVAIGECGLDYSRIQDSGLKMQEAKRQKDLFQKQIEIATKLSLPLSIHIRDAQQDLMEIFVNLYDSLEYHSELKGVFHCFSGDEQYLSFILEKLPGFYVSFAGNVTFKNAPQLRELAKQVPLDKLLVETDCPYLSPEPFRGLRNEPANVKTTAAKLAEIKNMSLEHISSIITENAHKLFKI